MEVALDFAVMKFAIFCVVAEWLNNVESNKRFMGTEPGARAGMVESRREKSQGMFVYKTGVEQEQPCVNPETF